MATALERAAALGRAAPAASLPLLAHLIAERRAALLHYAATGARHGIDYACTPTTPPIPSCLPACLPAFFLLSFLLSSLPPRRANECMQLQAGMQ